MLCYNFGIKRCSVRLCPRPNQLFVGRLMSFILCYLCLYFYSAVKYVLIISITWRVSYKRQELLPFASTWVYPPIFGRVGGSHLFSFLCCIFCFCLSSSCVPNVTSVSELSILDSPFDFF
jgi:hypothetical protein